MSWPPSKARKNIGGRYLWVDGKLQKVSEKTHVFYDAFVPESGYMDENLGHQNEATGQWVSERIESREQKARLLREKGVVEDGGWGKNPAFRRMYFDCGR